MMKANRRSHSGNITMVSDLEYIFVDGRWVLTDELSTTPVIEKTPNERQFVEAAIQEWVAHILIFEGEDIFDSLVDRTVSKERPFFRFKPTHSVWLDYLENTVRWKTGSIPELVEKGTIRLCGNTANQPNQAWA